MGKLKILVIDDEEGIRDMIWAALSSSHEVVPVSSGEEGIDLFPQTPPFDLVMTDRNMPGGMFGEEVVRKIKKLNEALGVKAKVILMTSATRDLETIKEMATAAGADAVVDKYFWKEELDKFIQQNFPR